MTPKQIGKVWATTGLLLAYYALNSWIVSQGGEEVFGAKLVVKGKAPTALVAIIVCGLLLILNSLIGLTFARRSGGRAWHERIPVVLLDAIVTGSNEERIYQAFMFTLLSILPAISLIHFWSVVLQSKIASTDDPPKPIGSIWDWSHFAWNDPARICTTYTATPTIVCGQNSTILPGLEPTVLAVLTAMAVLALVLHVRSVVRPAKAAGDPAVGADSGLQ